MPSFRYLAFAAFLLTIPVSAQSPTLTKIDPPNWFATLPSPTLVIQGTNLQNAHFTISDPAVRASDTKVSPNGH